MSRSRCKQDPIVGMALVLKQDGDVECEGGCPLCLIERGGRIGRIKRCRIGLIPHGLGGFARPC